MSAACPPCNPPNNASTTSASAPSAPWSWATTTTPAAWRTIFRQLHNPPAPSASAGCGQLPRAGAWGYLNENDPTTTHHRGFRLSDFIRPGPWDLDRALAEIGGVAKRLR